MEKYFTEIYKTNHWGYDGNNEYNGSSGPGSEIHTNIPYINFLPMFIIQNNIQNAIDLGCGTCKCLNIIYDNLNVKYFGYDCYKDIVEYNIKKKSSDKYKFFHLDIFKDKELIENGDMCILKDILMHWKLVYINEFLDYLIECKKFKYILIVNCGYQNEDNTDILNNGNWRPLSANFLPLKKYSCQIVGYYNSKEISLISL